jgi:hypothetical protein
MPESSESALTYSVSTRDASGLGHEHRVLCLGREAAAQAQVEARLHILACQEAGNAAAQEAIQAAEAAVARYLAEAEQKVSLQP